MFTLFDTFPLDKTNKSVNLTKCTLFYEFWKRDCRIIHIGKVFTK